MVKQIEWILFSILLVFNSVISILGIKYCREYFKLQFKARNRRLVILSVFFIIVNISISFPLHILAEAYRRSGRNDSKKGETDISLAIQFIWATIYIFFNYGALYLICMRTWLLFYKIRWGLESSNSKWKVHIDESLKDQKQNNFFYIYLKTLGNEEYLQKPVFCVYLIQCLLFYTLLVIGINANRAKTHMQVFNICELSLYFCIIVFIAGIFFTLPKFKDNHQIAVEMKYILGCTCGTLCVDIGLTVTSIIANNPPPMVLFILYLLASIGFGAVIFFQTYYVLEFTNSRHSSKTNFPLIPVNDDPPQTQPVGTPTEQNSPIPQIIHKNTLRYILSTQETFEMFMNYCLKEFNSEALLAFIELIKWKQFLLDTTLKHYVKSTVHKANIKNNRRNKRRNNKRHKEIKGIKYQLAPEIMAIRSTIMDEDKHQLSEKFHLLIAKYIQPNSIFELNISGRQRNFLLKKASFNTFLNHKKAYTIFDDTLYEVYTLLCDVFGRFKRSEEWQHWIQENDNNNEVLDIPIREHMNDAV